MIYPKNSTKLWQVLNKKRKRIKWVNSNNRKNSRNQEKSHKAKNKVKIC